MRIEIDRLAELGGKFSRLYESGELVLDDAEVRVVGLVEVSGRLRREGKDVELRGELQTRVETVCNRCLQPVELPIRSDFTERFVPAVAWRDEEQHELSEEDLSLSVFDGEAIELDDVVREEILLAMPGHVWCREDCQGLCPVCGIDKNTGTCQCEVQEIDSRWQGLKNLQL
jgi:uncharacterized protein